MKLNATQKNLLTSAGIEIEAPTPFSRMKPSPWLQR